MGDGQCDGMRVRYEDEDSDEAEDETYEDEVDLGPDDRDADLMDGRWEDRYYSGQVRKRDWNSIYLAVGLVIVMAMVLPVVLAALR